MKFGGVFIVFFMKKTVSSAFAGILGKNRLISIFHKMAFLTSAPTTLVLTVVTISGRFGSDVIFEDVEQVEEPPAKLGAGRIGGNARPAVALPI